MTLHTQALTMFAMIASGLYLGFTYTTFQTIFYKWLKLAPLTYILEVLFGLSQAIVVFYILYKVNQGDVRLYVFISLALGYSVYQVLFKQLYEQTLHQLEKVSIKLWKHILRLLHIVIWSPLLYLFRPLWKVLQKGGLILLRPVYQRIRQLKKRLQGYTSTFHRFLLKLFQNKGKM